MLKRILTAFLFPLLVFAQAPKVTVTTRQAAGAALTFVQADKNFTDLQAAANASRRAWGWKESATSGLTWAYYGGPAWNGTTWTMISDGTLALTANASNYIERTAGGAVTVSTTGWTGNLPLALVVTGASSVTSTTDYRGSLESVAQSLPNAPGGPLFALKTALTEGLTTGIQILSDSTGNDTTDWPYILAQQIAASYPNFTVDHLLWSDATQTYAAPTRIQTGTAGERYLDCGAGNYASLTDPATSVGPTTTTTPIDVRAKVSLTSWTPAALQYIIMLDKGAAPGIGWRFYVNTAGTLGFLWSPDGTAANSVASTVGTGFAANDIRWIRCLFNPNDGSGNRVTKFYTSTDGATWTQLGTTVTTAGATTVFNPLPTYGYWIGGVNNGPAIYTKIYAVDVRDGDTGPSLVPIMPDLWSTHGSATTPQPLVGAPVLTVVNGSHPGANISYLGNATRLPKMVPNYGQAVTFASDNHNEAYITGAAWGALYKTWTDLIKAKLPNAGIVAMTQNPETSAAVLNRTHARRRLDLLGFRATQALEVMDIYKVFMDAGFPGSLMTDSVHPNTTGSTLWATYVKRRIDQATR